MKKTKLTNEVFHDDTCIDSFPWLSILDVVIWKIEQIDRVNSKISHSINYSLIVDLAGVIEGFINQILDNSLETRTSIISNEGEINSTENDVEENRNEFIDRLTDDLKNKIDNSSWNGYNQVFEIIFGEKIQNKISSKTWKSITSLFTYRNMIIHGKILSINYKHIERNEYSISVKNKYQTVYSYLTENKLITKGETGYVNMINKNIIIHYYKAMGNFINEILQSIDNKNEKNRILRVLLFDKNLSEIIDNF